MIKNRRYVAGALRACNAVVNGWVVVLVVESVPGCLRLKQCLKTLYVKQGGVGVAVYSCVFVLEQGGE